MVTATRGTATFVTGRIPLTETAPRGSGRWARYAAAFLALVGGTVLLTSAVPRTIAAFSMMPGDSVLNAIQRDEQVRASDLELLASSREAALAWIEAGRVWTDLGLAQLRRANKAGLWTAEGRRHLDESVSSLRRGLALAPANPFAWARLGYVELVRGGPSTAAAEALKMSMLTGAYEPLLMFSRLNLCLRVWREFDEEGRALVAQQIRFADNMSRTRLARLVKKWDASPVVADALKREKSYRQMYGWAEIYRKGEGVEKDPAMAVELYRLVAETGNARAQYQLAESYSKGEGIEKDPAKAVELYRLVAEAGNAWAQYKLAESYRKGEGVEKDPVKAVELYRLAAETGNVWAQYQLAESYRKGEGVEKDMERATEWYRKAAQQGHDLAETRLRDLAGSSQ